MHRLSHVEAISVLARSSSEADSHSWNPRHPASHEPKQPNRTPPKQDDAQGPDTSPRQGSPCCAPEGLCGRRARDMVCLSFVGGCIGQAAPFCRLSNRTRPVPTSGCVTGRLGDGLMRGGVGRRSPYDGIERCSTYRRPRRGQRRVSA
jgi:hypothetical protein